RVRRDIDQRHLDSVEVKGLLQVTIENRQRRLRYFHDICYPCRTYRVGLMYVDVPFIMLFQQLFKAVMDQVAANGRWRHGRRAEAIEHILSRTILGHVKIGNVEQDIGFQHRQGVGVGVIAIAFFSSDRMDRWRVRQVIDTQRQIIAANNVAQSLEFSDEAAIVWVRKMQFDPPGARVDQHNRYLCAIDCALLYGYNAPLKLALIARAFGVERAEKTFSFRLILALDIMRCHCLALQVALAGSVREEQSFVKWAVVLRQWVRYAI